MHQAGDGLPMGLADTEDQDFAVGGFIDVGWTGGAVAIAHPRVWLPFEFVGNQAAHRRDRHVEHRDLDLLSASAAAALDQRGEYSAEQMAAGTHVDEGGRRARARSIGKSRD